jgi:A/G-specific adenine glycosylase
VARPGPRPFAERLLGWWDRHGRKHLPWQQPRTPYRVWVSEIMLQQTQVATVIPYFERWMARFPDIESLAEAPLDDVLSHWSGLGYYARARNLHKTARLCRDDHGGELPLEAVALSALPGIGESTANAIVSQATDRPAAVLDGNVRRVLARHAAIEGWTGKAAVQKALWTEAVDRLPAARGADYTQAVMDLGALVCTRSGPACGDCPVGEDCAALQRGRVDELPTKKPATKVTDQALYLLVLKDGAGRVLLEKRPPAGIWGGLWCLPDAETPDSLEQKTGLKLNASTALPPFEHRLSHRRLTLHPLKLNGCDSRQVKCAGACEWFSPAQWPELGLPRPVARLLGQLQHGETE